MIYFDNSATSFPKPKSVIDAVNKSLVSYSANSGRGGYELSKNTAAEVFAARQTAADFFNADGAENVIFTHNCTASLNYIIKGLAEENDHFIVSCLEHNAVIRPLERLKRERKISYSIAEVGESDEKTVESFKSKIRKNTKAIITTHASNVTGEVLPVKMLAELAHSYGLLFAVDAAQTSGVLKLDVKEQGIDFLAVAAHKGLYAPMGIGLMIINSNYPLKTTVEGGTGSVSESPVQPDFLPDRFESGTLSVPLISGAKAGVEFVNRLCVDKIRAHEHELISYLYGELREMKDLLLYTDPESKSKSFVPILPLNVRGLHSEETAELLAADGICVRAGFHCAFSAHKFCKTDSVGAVRISPSVFTRKKDVNLLLNSLFKIAKSQ